MILKTNDEKLQKAIMQLNEFTELYTKQNEYNISVNWTQSPKITWSLKENEITISCKDICSAITAIGFALKGEGESGEVTPRFEKLETMIDLSRNAVYTVNKMKSFLCQTALMGYTGCLLYMEDTYELPDYPYWGYQRGRYSTEELKELDEFAGNLGLELIACIQTLAHLRTALRWKCFEEFRDTMDNLMVGDEKTLELVEKMLIHFKNTLKTDRIHLGMDESFGLGAGRYRIKYGFKDHRELIREHLKAVCELCKKHGLKPMIWDDMLFRDHTPNMNYYCDSEPITEKELSQYPDNLTFVYWDYYHNTKEEYLTQLKRRGELKTAFAGGIWKWGGWTPNYTKSFKDTKAAMEACFERGVSEIIMTAWGDDGAEAPLDCLLAGFAFAGLSRFTDANPSDTDSICMLLSNCHLKQFEDMELLDLIPNMPKENLEASMPHKSLLFSDIASDRYIYNMGCSSDELVNHYSKLVKLYDSYIKTSCQNKYMLNMMKVYKSLANVLQHKCGLSDLLHKSWKAKDINSLKNVQDKIFELCKYIKTLQLDTVNMWSAYAKGQGLEIINLRLGGLIGRLEAIDRRLQLYFDGELETLTELDEEILTSSSDHTDGLQRDLYGDIVTVNTLYHFNNL